MSERTMDGVRKVAEEAAYYGMATVTIALEEASEMLVEIARLRAENERLRGFTWEDVDAMEAVYRKVIASPDALDPELCDAVERHYDLARRIAATLPPRS
jgi:hypothetical protein